MKHISSRIASYTFLYVLLFFFIFFVQFRKGTHFSYESSHLSISGRFFVNEQKEKELLLPLHITSNGLLIFITAEEPIRAVMQDDSIKNLNLLSYEIKDAKISLLCDNDTSLVFATSDENIETAEDSSNSLHITCNVPSHIKEVRLPYSLTQNARIKKEGRNIFVQYQNKSFEFSRLQDGLIGQKDSLPFISFSKESSSIYYHERVGKAKLDVDSMLSSSFASKEVYQKNKNALHDFAMQSLDKKTRERKHNEKTIVALFAEHGRRGLYQSAKNKYPLSLLQKNRRTYLSSTFYGNVIENYKMKESYDEGELSKIRTKLNSRDLSLFEIPKLLDFLLYRGEDELLNSLIDFADSVDEKALGALEVANMLHLFLDYKDAKMQGKDLSFLAKRCEKEILTRLFSIGDKAYISTSDGNIESLSIFYISNALIRYGESENNSTCLAIGYLLFNSLYSFVEEPTSFPSLFRIKNEEDNIDIIASDKGVLGLEDLYTVLFPNETWYTHESYIFNDEELKIFAITIAKEIVVRYNKSRSLALEFSFERGESHYAVLVGVPEFSNIKIDDKIGYKTDPRFESYNASGYIYDRETKTLYLKLKHNREKEIVEFFY